MRGGDLVDTVRDELVATGDAEKDSEAMLERYWSLGPHIPTPVDPIFIARELGLAVYVARLEPEVGGMLVNQPGKQPTIYLSTDDHRNRQRFTCAHELGHWMKRSGQGSDWAFVDRRDQLSGRGTDPDERYANGFGAALLMPASEVQALSGHMSTEAMSRHFGVSAQAMAFRLANLGIPTQR